MQLTGPRLLRFPLLVALWLLGAHPGILPAQTEPKITPPSSGDLFTNGLIPELHLEISPQNMNILRGTESPWTRRVVPRTNVFIRIREGKTIYTNVQVHLKGSLGSFRSVDEKPAFTISFNKKDPGQFYRGYSKIYLNNSVQDPSYLSELISREMFLKAGIAVPRATHAVVYLNGRILGMYVLVEGWTRQFLKNHFKDPNGHIYDSGLARDIDQLLEKDLSDSPEDRSDLEALLAATQHPNPVERLPLLEKKIDLDEFRKFIAMEIMLAHWDGYAMNRNNYRIYSEPGNGKMHFLPHGMDQMFGSWQSRPDSPITPRMRGMLAKALMQIPDARKKYLDQLEELHSKVYKPEELRARIGEVGARVNKMISKFDVAEAQEHLEAIRHLQSRVVQRAQSVREQLIAQKNMGTNVLVQTGSLVLKNWTQKLEMGNVRMSKSATNLVIEGAGTASWRSSLLLQPGTYVLRGKVKTENVAFPLTASSSSTRPGIGFRISGEQLTNRVSGTRDWHELTYEFVVDSPSESVFVCDFRNSSGKAWFDLTSLKIERR